MYREKVTRLLAALIVACPSCAILAADGTPTAGAPKHSKKMKMDEPMPTGMAREGTMKGDMKDSAARKAKAMQPMMEQEEKSMPQDKPKP